MRLFLVLFLLSLNFDALSGGIQLGILPTEICDQDQSNGNDLVSPPNDEANEQCVLLFRHVNGNLEPDVLYDMEALIYLDGKITTIYRIKYDSIAAKIPNQTQPTLGLGEVHVFSSKDRVLEVVLEAHVASTSCRQDSESCCGDDYIGTLIVRTNEGSTSMSIAYYRGG